MIMSDKFFFQNLPGVEDYSEIVNPENFSKTPDSWYILLTDIDGSTKAIEEGRYKEVNIVGASVIVALTNLCRPLEIPYVFGGDGATVLIPAEFKEEAVNVMASTRQMAKESFNFNLRCAIIPVKDIHEAGFEILISRYNVSKHYSNAVFSGGGLDYAELILKDDVKVIPYQLLSEETLNNADFSGLECRWDNVKPAEGKIIALLIKARSTNPAERYQIYSQLFNNLKEVYPDLFRKKIFRTKELNFTLSWEKLNLENKIHSFRGGTKRIYYKFKIYGQILLGALMMKFNITTDGFNWGNYKKDLISNTDSKKFDEMIRMVFDSNDENFEKLKVMLEKYKKSGLIVYGYNVSDSAILTCIVERRKDKHFHLIDGSDGGYALAAKMLKGML